MQETAEDMSQPFSAPLHYPTPSSAALQLQFVGKNINDVAAPAAVIDAAVVRRNCKLMLETASKLGLGFRAHVKTHKVRTFGIPSTLGIG